MIIPFWHGDMRVCIRLREDSVPPRDGWIPRMMNGGMCCVCVCYVCCAVRSVLIHCNIVVFKRIRILFIYIELFLFLREWGGDIVVDSAEGWSVRRSV